MARVFIFQLDGKLPNIALMRIAAHHRALGDELEFYHTGNPERYLWSKPDLVYGSAIFEKSARSVEKLRSEYPGAILGGTGVAVDSSLEAIGISTIEQDYSIYPRFRQSIGFSQRGCRLRCPFCVVPRKEGAWRSEQSIFDLWRGDPWPREILLLDNDFFGQQKGVKPVWPQRINEIKRGHFKVSFTQGINARFLDDEAAAAVASIDYRDDSMANKRIYTAWDNKQDEEKLFAGLGRLVKYGVRPDHIMVYMLIGYWPGETTEDRLYRQKKLRAFGCRPYPMPFIRSPELVGFRRWVIGAYDKRISWWDFARAKYQPRNLGLLPTPA